MIHYSFIGLAYCFPRSALSNFGLAYHFPLVSVNKHNKHLYGLAVYFITKASWDIAYLVSMNNKKTQHIVWVTIPFLVGSHNKYHDSSSGLAYCSTRVAGTHLVSAMRSIRFMPLHIVFTSRSNALIRFSESKMFLRPYQ